LAPEPERAGIENPSIFLQRSEDRQLEAAAFKHKAFVSGGTSQGFLRVINLFFIYFAN
jgi:hypothetical protein